MWFISVKGHWSRERWKVYTWAKEWEREKPLSSSIWKYISSYQRLVLGSNSDAYRAGIFSEWSRPGMRKLAVPGKGGSPWHSTLGHVETLGRGREYMEPDSTHALNGTASIYTQGILPAGMGLRVLRSQVFWKGPKIQKFWWDLPKMLVVNWKHWKSVLCGQNYECVSDTLWWLWDSLPQGLQSR